MKRLIGVLIRLLFCIFISIPGFTDETDILEPQVDFEFIVITNNQTKTVTVDLTLPVDVKFIPVMVIGSGGGGEVVPGLDISMNRLDTKNELVGIMQIGTGIPSFDYRWGFTPVTLNLSTIKITNGGFIFIVTGGYFTSQGAHKYKVTVKFGPKSTNPIW